MKTKTLNVPHLAHRGIVRAAGFVFSAAVLSETETRRRILAVWQPGARVLRSERDLIYLAAEPFSVDCRRAAGAPLVRTGDVYAAFPLGKNNLNLPDDAGETLVRLRGGRIETGALRDLPIENIENWFDVSAFTVIETRTLGEVPTKPRVVERITAVDVRGKLPKVPEAASEMAEMLQTLRRKKDEIAKSRLNSASPNANLSGSSDSFAESLGGFFDSLKNFFTLKGGQSYGNSSAQNYASSTINQPSPPGRLRRAFNSALFQLKIAQMLGRKQARYLAEMMEMFERGDLDAALRHAIPLEDVQMLKDIASSAPLPPFLGFLRPRDSLQIDYGRRAAANSSVYLEDEWLESLRVTYRQTFDRLVAQNRIEEAAFVLAELLKSHHEAVEFLEKHGKYRLAAELAEARDLPKDVIVRQWFLAGERQRAVQLAALHDCFQYAVEKLEQQKHAQAAELREIWAETLAASGNFPAAVDTLWKLETRRARAAEWIERAIAFGGAPGARMLAKKIVLLPERFAEAKAKLLEIAADERAEAVETRAAFARETLRIAPNRELKTLARPLARRLLADLATGGARHFAPTDLRRLIETAGDYTLRADLPKLPDIADEAATETFALEIAFGDRGASRVWDAHLLPNGKIAVALGEAGVKILSETGGTVAHFDQPAHRFVVSDFGTNAVALARRGDVYRLARIDFVERRGDYWCDAALDAFAATFDGNLWFASEKDAVYALDARAAKYEAVWRVSELGARVAEIRRTKTKLMLTTANERGYERWSYDLPQFVLRSRNQTKWLETDNENQTVHSIAAFVAYSIVQIAETAGDQTSYAVRVYDYDVRTAAFAFPNGTTAIGTAQIFEKFYALSSVENEAATVRLYEVPNKLIAEFKLGGATEFSAKLDENFLTVADAAGRVLIYDYRQRVLRRNLRV